jgi:hypothetical protein
MELQNRSPWLLVRIEMIFKFWEGKMKHWVCVGVINFRSIPKVLIKLEPWIRWYNSLPKNNSYFQWTKGPCCFCEHKQQALAVKTREEWILRKVTTNHKFFQQQQPATTTEEAVISLAKTMLNGEWMDGWEEVNPIIRRTCTHSTEPQPERAEQQSPAAAEEWLALVKGGARVARSFSS